MRFRQFSSRLRALLPLAAALALLPGCASFESPPSGALAACDPRLVGEWYTGEWVREGALEPERNDADTTWLSIAPETCALADRRDGERPSDIAGYSLRYLPGAGGGYLVATNGKLGAQPGWTEEDDKAVERAVESERERGLPATTHMIFRYTVDADRIAVYQIDPLRLARLILTGKASGRVYQDDGEAIASARQLDAALAKARADDDEARIHSYARGPQARVDALLAAHKNLFFARPMGILRRAKPPAADGRAVGSSPKTPRPSAKPRAKPAPKPAPGR